MFLSTPVCFPQIVLPHEEKIADLFRNLDILFLKKAKQKSRYTDIKNRRERCSRFKMMFYVTALNFKDGTVFAPIHSLTVPKRIEWWVSVFSLSIPLALGGFATSQSYIVFSCAPHLRGLYYTIKPAANQEIYDGF